MQRVVHQLLLAVDDDRERVSLGTSFSFQAHKAPSGRSSPLNNAQLTQTFPVVLSTTKQRVIPRDHFKFLLSMGHRRSRRVFRRSRGNRCIYLL